MSEPKPGHFAPSSSLLTPLRFGSAGRFELQPAERRLLVDGQPVALGARAFDVLITLTARPDRLVSKNELLDRVWSGLVVEEANLQMQISNLRKVLGSDAIATVPGRGYRFVAPVMAAVAVPMESSAQGAPVVGGPAGDAARPSQQPPASLVAPGGAPVPVAALPLRNPQRLFGRDADMARLEGLLQTEACVTLVGPAGVGKTSLARAAAARAQGRSVWVDVAPLTQADQVAGALARALGKPLETPSGRAPDAAEAMVQLLRSLHDLLQAQQQAQQQGQQQDQQQGQTPAQPQAPSLLIVLDNAEHLVQACAELVSSLRAQPGLHLLVTSQLPLAVAGEQVQRLDPLALEPPGANPSELGDGALALLVERIASADHRFAVGATSLATLAEICQQLDGLPLALEMAAARVPLMGLQGVRDALAQRFSLLTRGHRDAATRHRTLHNALDWSYRLLDDQEQRLFRALGVFAGGFTLDLALATMADEAAAPPTTSTIAPVTVPSTARHWEIIDGLAALADRSLVTVSADDPPRYRLLDTMRAFALQAMAAAGDDPGELDAVRRQHANAVAALFARYQPGEDAADRLCLPEIENAREAIAWALANEPGLAVHITTRASRHSTFSAWRNECSQWLRALRPLMESAAGEALPAEIQAAWWSEMARTGIFLGDPQAGAVAKRALLLFQPLQQPSQALFAAVGWVRSIAQAGAELDEACAAMQAQFDLLATPTARERFWLHGALTKAALVRGDYEAVLEGRLAEMQLARELGSEDQVETAESNVVNALNWLKRYPEALERGQALLARIDGRNGDANGNLPWLLPMLLVALIETGRLAEASALLPRAQAAGRRFGSLAILPLQPLLAAAQGRFEVAARLVGYARQRYESSGVLPANGDEQLMERVQRNVARALEPALAESLVRQGRALDEDSATELARQ